MGQIAEAVKVAVETIEKKSRPEEKTTQLVKPRFPPLWSGQEFDRWRIEVEKWFDNNKSTDEEKYIDLLKNLKKNEVIKEFVVKTLVEKVGEIRTVKKIPEVKTAKFTKTTCEKIAEMITETDKIRLAENLKYAMGLNF